MSSADRARFQALARQVIDYQLMEKSYRRLQQDSAKMILDIASHDTLIQSLTTQVDNYKYQYQMLSIKSTSDQKTISYLEQRNEELKKPKRFGVGPVAGYGFSGPGANTFVGIGITYTLLRW